MAKDRVRDVLGVKVTHKKPCGVSEWILDGITYRWSPEGWLLTGEGDKTRRLMYSRRLEGAVGYTAGWHDASNLAARANHASANES